MADLAKINGTSIEDLAKLWGKDVADIATVMGLDVPSGTAKVFNSASTTHISVTTMDSTHAIVCYRDAGDSSYGTAVALTLSGTTITEGTAKVFKRATEPKIDV